MGVGFNTIISQSHPFGRKLTIEEFRSLKDYMEFKRKEFLDLLREHEDKAISSNDNDLIKTIQETRDAFNQAHQSMIQGLENQMQKQENKEE